MVSIPQFVNLNGKKTAFADLPKGTQDALIKRAREGDQAILNVLSKGTGTSTEINFTADQVIGSDLSGTSKTNLINKIIQNPQLSPREAIKIREKAIKSGVEHTNLHLGQATPEVLAQLMASREQQNFTEKKTNLQSEIDTLVDRGIVSGNSSTRPLQTQLTAKETFRRQQGFTKAVTGQVRTVLDSPEFALTKQSGGSIEEINQLINSNVTVASRSNSAIINELAQAEIQGEDQTARNIERILQAEGITTPVNVKLDGSSLGASFTTSESASVLPQLQQFQTILAGGLDTTGIDTQFADEPTILGLGGSSFPLGEIEADAQGVANIPIISDIGKLINELLGLDINPNITGLAVMAIPIFIILAVLL
jgi:hypothetical protein